MLQNKEKVNIDWHSQLTAVVKEVRILLLISLAAFLLLSLLSYSTADPGWRQAQSDLAVSNYGGRIGAFIADLLFSLFGHMAYLLAVIPILRGAQRFRGRDIKSVSYTHLTLPTIYSV